MSRSDYKDSILAAVPIETYIGKFVSLKKQGKSFKGLCPFHSEKTPSFHVTPEKGIYHCFGCGKGGDIFSFVMEYEGATFPEALDILGRYAGIEKPTTRYSERDKRLKLLVSVNEKAMNRFGEFLFSPDGRVAREYLLGRGLTEKTVREFELGASPEAWNWLEERVTDLPEVKDPTGAMVELGLLKKGNRDRPYDFFRGRVIFPIRDGSGRVSAFGGRVLPGSENPAKYLNSPESVLFQKSQVLYGLHQSLRGIRERKFCIVAEGYLDVIGLHQIGFTNTVAPLGTALGASHLKILHRYTDKLLVLLDGDSAGRAAALRFAHAVVDYGGISASVVLLPTGQDPFDLAMKLDFRTLEQVIGNSIPSYRYLLMETMFPGRLFDSDFLKTDETDPGVVAEKSRIFYTEYNIAAGLGIDEKRSGMSRLFDFLKGIKSSADRQLFLGEGARILNINGKDLEVEWRKVAPRDNRSAGNSADPGPMPMGRDEQGEAPRFAAPPEGYHEQPRGGAHQSTQRESRPNRLAENLARCEHQLLVELILNPPLVGAFMDDLNALDFIETRCEILWRNMEARFLTGETWTAETFQKAELPGEALSLVTGLLIQKAEQSVRADREGGDVRDGRAVVRELLLNHRKWRLQGAIEEIERRIAMADVVEKEELYKKYTELGREKQDLDARIKNVNRIS